MSMAHHAHALKQTMKAAGHEMTAAEAMAMAHLAEKVANAMAAEEAEKKAEARFKKQRSADVTAWTMNMRSVGMWDGE